MPRRRLWRWRDSYADNQQILRIVIFMNYNDHFPAHFHARYQDQEVTVEIASGLVQGRMARRELRMILEWSEKHQEELLNNWQLARGRRPLQRIAPLE